MITESEMEYSLRNATFPGSPHPPILCANEFRRMRKHLSSATLSGAPRRVTVGPELLGPHKTKWLRAAIVACIRVPQRQSSCGMEGTPALFWNSWCDRHTRQGFGAVLSVRLPGTVQRAQTRWTPSYDAASHRPNRVAVQSASNLYSRAGQVATTASV